MENPTRHIATAETLDGGVVITFDDGTSSLYSADLLYSFIAQAQPISEADSDFEPEP